MSYAYRFDMSENRENFMKKHKIDPRLFFDEHSLIIGAFRYYCGRMTIASASFADELARAWNSLRTDTQEVIKCDLEQLFAEDDAARRVESLFKPLGMDMDRKAWEKVREKWQRCTHIRGVRNEDGTSDELDKK